MRDKLFTAIVKNGCEEYGGNAMCDGNCFNRCEDCITAVNVGKLVDALIAEGVIVPPCKVGDTVYMPWQWGGTEGIAILTIERISITEARPTVRTDFYSDDYAYFDKYNCGVFSFDDFGKTVFLTREEAEKKLAKRSMK